MLASPPKPAVNPAIVLRAEEEPCVRKLPVRDPSVLTQCLMIANVALYAPMVSKHV